ncbi:hypothetical protein [Streptomyces noursei]|uniref:hypothetical protein n=1 Tax=Streptomyces noursei TaxID=1971 RepID=UPI0038209CB7
MFSSIEKLPPFRCFSILKNFVVEDAAVEDVRVEQLEGGRSIAVHTPYNTAFVSHARDLDGRWNKPVHGAWTFDIRDEERVRGMLRKIFGTDGRSETAGDVVTVRVRLADHMVGRSRAEFAGREIAVRPGRDLPVRFATGVVLIEGRLPRGGGSVRYPEIEAGDDVVVEIRDLPRGALETESEDSYEIVPDERPVEPATLREERARLLARVADIDALLEGQE